MKIKNRGDAILYCRVSTSGQVSGHGLQRQFEGGYKWAKENGYNLISVFSEYGSDFHGKNRLKAREQAQYMATSRDIPLLIEDLDRWSRDMILPQCKLIVIGIGEDVEPVYYNCSNLPKVLTLINEN